MEHLFDNGLLVGEVVWWSYLAAVVLSGLVARRYARKVRLALGIAWLILIGLAALAFRSVLGSIPFFILAFVAAYLAIRQERTTSHCPQCGAPHHKPYRPFDKACCDACGAELYPAQTGSSVGSDALPAPRPEGGEAKLGGVMRAIAGGLLVLFACAILVGASWQTAFVYYATPNVANFKGFAEPASTVVMSKFTYLLAPWAFVFLSTIGTMSSAFAKPSRGDVQSPFVHYRHLIAVALVSGFLFWFDHIATERALDAAHKVGFVAQPPVPCPRHLLNCGPR
jgi:hypothetical protein